LKFPDEAKLSSEAKDIISRLLCDVEHRLGTRGVQEIKVGRLQRTLLVSLHDSYHVVFLNTLCGDLLCVLCIYTAFTLVSDYNDGAL